MAPAFRDGHQLAPVVNVHDVVANVLFAMSRMLVALPVRVTVYWVFAARLTAGFWIHWFVVPFRLTTTPTAVPVDVAFRLNEAPFTPCTASLKVASMFAVRLTPVRLTAGVRAVTVGAVTSAAVGVTALLPAENALVPTALVAATRKVYAVPLVSPVTWVVSTLPRTRLAPTWVVPANTRSV